MMGNCMEKDMLAVRGGGPDQMETLRFRGERVASKSTRGTIPGLSADRQFRWTELSIFRIDDESGRYVLQVVGRSLLYHRPDGPCGQGVPIRVVLIDNDTYETAVPCDIPGCKPRDLERLKEQDVVHMEDDRYRATVCESAEAVVEELRDKGAHRKKAFGRSTYAAGPESASASLPTNARELLASAAKVDPKFYAVLHPERFL